ncbi:MAG TPA: methyltransferase domain-containing protein [Acidimicrobiales bacterium]|nr:methyltransferase domain-containing protein [Acidimicrobiales bacterium]
MAPVKGYDVGDPAPASAVPPLPWTGERFIPSQGGPEIYYEHAHRYVIARSLLDRATVVDLASGEGYGAAWVAEVAESVTGIDIDEASVQHARARYAGQKNLEFALGDIQALPLADNCVDAVTCFEAIEHVENPRAVVEEVVRVLRPGGLLLVSTPNKAVYADERDYNNEFHVHEFYLPDLELLLGDYFPERDLLGQRVVAGSLTWRLDGDAPVVSADQGGAGISLAPGFAGNRGEPAAMVEPMYVLAACRLAGVPRVTGNLPAGNVFVDPEEQLLEVYRRASSPGVLEELTAHVRDQDGQLERARAQLAAYEEQATQLRWRIRELDEQSSGHALHEPGGSPEANALGAALLDQQELASRLSRDLEAATELNLRLLVDLRAQQRALETIQASPAAPSPSAPGEAEANGLTPACRRWALSLSRRLPLPPRLVQPAVRRLRRLARWL